jgi:hypothetical protein
MSLISASVGLVGRALISVLSRLLTPREIAVDMGMLTGNFVADNLNNKNIEYCFARRDKVIASRQKGWEIAIGRRMIFFTESYVDRRGELILLC